MRKDELIAVFDRQAGSYDKQWKSMAPIRDGLYLLVESIFDELPDDAQILCVGVGTGAELAYLARKFPGWRFTAVEPSGPMLDVCQQRAERDGFASRCHFHEGYLDSLTAGQGYHAATCFLVSQFILEPQDRSQFFFTIANRLHPNGLLVSADLALGAVPGDFESLLRAWLTLLSGQSVTDKKLEKSRSTYSNDVAVLHPREVSAIIQAGGFEQPVQFFQAGLLHAWFSRRLAKITC